MNNSAIPTDELVRISDSAQSYARNLLDGDEGTIRADVLAALIVDASLREKGLERERDAARADAAELRRFLNEDVMPRYAELLEQSFIEVDDSILIEQAKAIVDSPNPGAPLLEELERLRAEVKQ